MEKWRVRRPEAWDYDYISLTIVGVVLVVFGLMLMGLSDSDHRLFLRSPKDSDWRKLDIPSTHAFLT